MKAYFNSKIQRPALAFLSIAFLLFSLLGTHWLGYQHAIEHAGTSSASPHTAHHADSHYSPKSAEANHLKSHCLLFDALTLAGFVGSSPLISLSSIVSSVTLHAYETTLNPTPALQAYQSRAPPPFIPL